MLIPADRERLSDGGDAQPRLVEDGGVLWNDLADGDAAAEVVGWVYGRKG